jgi:hypothetical protein
MKILKKQIENYGLNVSIVDKRYLWIKACDTTIKFDAYELFGLENEDLILSIKQKFYQYNIKIDIHVPENNKSTPIKNKKENYITIDDRKKNIRKILKNKFKLIS